MTDPNPAAPLTEAGRNLLVEVEAAAYRGGGISVARTHDAIRDIEIEARKSVLDAARATSTPAGLREALDELAEAFPVDDVSPAPWVVERGPITWMIREGTGGAQIGNFILEADARYVAEARNRAALQGADR